MEAAVSSLNAKLLISQLYRGIHPTLPRTRARRFTNCTGHAVLWGLSGALDTQCSQAWGAGHPKKVGIFYQRVRVSAVVVRIRSIWHSTRLPLMDYGVVRVSHPHNMAKVCFFAQMCAFEASGKLHPLMQSLLPPPSPSAPFFSLWVSRRC